MQAAHLIDRHLALFEAPVVDRVVQVVDQKALVDLLLIREAGRIDRFGALQKLARRFKLTTLRGFGKIGRSIVVAFVAEDGGVFGMSAEVELPLLFDQIGERLAAFVEISGCVLCRGQRRRDQKETDQKADSHHARPV